MKVWISKVGLTVCLLATARHLPAQTLDWSAFRQQILSTHPLARRAAMAEDQISALRLRARGGFDPKTFAGYDQKNFKGQQYYSHAQGGLKIPTWAGLELKAGYQYASGNYLDPENKLPKQGQAGLGLEWSLGQGLLFDERRADLLMADVWAGYYRAVADLDRSELVYESAKIYWSWVHAVQALSVIEQSLVQTRVRHEAMKESFLQGEKPAVDTLESFIQLQNRTLDWQLAQTEARNCAVAVAQWYWMNDEQTIAVENLPAPAPFPPLSNNPDFAFSMPDALAQHPDLQIYNAKMRLLELERRLKNEKRKPVFQISYQLLGDTWTFFPASETGGAVLANSAKWGVDFSYPLFNRKARAEMQLNRVKAAQTDLERNQKQALIQSKLTQYDNERQTLYRQGQLAAEIAANYRLLFEAETEKWNQGESSIFLLNVREQRWLDAQLKWLKLQLEIRKVEAAILLALGRT